ncbi:MAG TPA: DUF2189 domain-containing protein [Nitrobacter sp.]|nr:DUF2189 domain-containing protein [Nitrobacter sp.]
MAKPDIIIPPIVAPLPIAKRWRRNLTPASAFEWLALGWQDFRTAPGASIAYGVLIFLLSAIIVGGLFRFELDYILFPALAGFMVIGPILAVGPYVKSRMIAAGEPVSLARMIFVRPASGAQIMFTGVLLCLLMLVWMRAAVIIYALFFGLVPFPGLDHVAAMLFGSPTGWAMLLVGTVVGALFASFSFAISAFSIPMQLDQRTDALTAMGSSLALVWSNLPTMLTWAAIMLALILLSIATGLLGLIVVFPVLGHGTWHAWRAVQPV